MTPRLLTLDRIWLLVLTVLLLLSIAGNAALLQAANDSPVHVYSASTNDQAAGGASTHLADNILGTSHDELVHVTTSNLSAAHTHTCVVTASALAQHDTGSGQFIFGLSMDNVLSRLC